MCEACDADETLCGNECADLRGDDDHCGGCFIECRGGLECIRGGCGVEPG